MSLNKLIILFWFLLTWASTARANPIEIQGVDSSHQQMLMEKLPKLGNRPVALDLVDEALRLLMATGEFERVTAERTPEGVKIIATPLRLVGDIKIEGNQLASDKALLEVIQIEPGEKFDRRKILRAGEELKAFYGERGYFNTVIEVEFLKKEKNQLTIHFAVTENEPCLVSSLRFEGANTDLGDKLLSRTRRFLKKPLTTDLIDQLRETIHDYFKDKQYMKATLSNPDLIYNKEKTRADITFRVNEPFAYQIFFEGYDFLTKSALYKLVRSFDYKQGQFEPRTELASLIKNHYLQLGFPSVEVKPQLEEFPETYIRRLTFKISEGPRVKIKSFEIGGRISRPEFYYSDFIRKNSTDLLRKGYYNREDLELAYQNLITELRNQGFLRARIQSSRLEFSDQPGEAKVVLTLDEGPLTQISRIEFEGIKDFTEAELLDQLKIKNNSPLRLKNLEESINLLKSFYLSKGYLEMKLLNENEDLVEYNERGTQAYIRFKIFEGPQVRVRAITLEGNDFTDSEVILNEIDFSEGDILTVEKIDESIIRLNRLGIFSRVSIRMVEEGTSVSDRTVLVSVTERDPGLLRFGAGLNSERTLTARGFIGLTYNNLFGTARSVSGRVELQSNIADINYLEHKVSAGYLEPFLFGTRTRGRINVTRSDEVFNTFENENGDIVQLISSDRVDFLIERDLSRHYRLTHRLWSLDARKESERNGKCPDASEGYKCPSETQQIAVVGPILDIDYRDNSFVPTRGSYTRLSLEYSHPDLGSSEKIEFLRTEAVFNYYLRLGTPKWVWANSFGGGYVTNLNNQPGSGVPVKYAFFLGGSSTLRGYESNNDAERVPNDQELPIEGPIQLIIPKDSHYFLYKSELRWNIVGDHGAVLFYDGGMVKVSGYDFEKPYRQSIGIGYRYNTPVGPLRIDIGFKLDRRSVEREYRGHFAIGTF